MGKNQRRNHRLRRQRWDQAGVLQLSYEPLAPGDRATVKQLWRLYRQNGERNGQLGELARHWEKSAGLPGEHARLPRVSLLPVPLSAHFTAARQHLFSKMAPCPWQPAAHRCPSPEPPPRLSAVAAAAHACARAPARCRSGGPARLLAHTPAGRGPAHHGGARHQLPG